ncbi:secreted Ly-6/uPAR-related protein 1-like [Phyllobates terribilis]|uniref:secreted Ly-6/uPAR-related protein 1-like n=1 Tax=Phyllobates terribilis TaxID=111132 RepID=UPI003CCA7473
MTTIWIFLVTLALFYKPGGCIMCYYCPDGAFSSECTDTKNCTAANSVCKTTVISPEVGYPFLGNEVVIRGCSLSQICLDNNQDELGNSQIVFCCRTDLCNNRGLNATGWNGNGAVTHIHTPTAIFLLGILGPLSIMWL